MTIPAQAAVIQTEALPLKFSRPKILLIDLDDDVATKLEQDGYSISTGSFGTPYKVAKGAGFQPVIINASLPNYSEQEVIVIDLAAKPAADGPVGEKTAPMEELDWWAKCSEGIIDPRPRVMLAVQGDSDRIFDAGGVFVIFADAPVMQQFVHASVPNGYSSVTVEKKLPFHTWCFLSELKLFGVRADHGEEISTVSNDFPLLTLLAGHLAGSYFSCIFNADWQLGKRWVPLATNKYGSPVAAMVAPREKSRDGWIFVLPQISNKPGFLADFITDVLPDFAPTFFPDADGQKWVHRVEYEFLSVQKMKDQIAEVQAAADAKVEDLEKAIAEEQKQNEYLYDLIRGTGDDLVVAVRKALAVLGFKSIVDVDAEMKKAGKGNSLREDLRIHDQSPTLIVDIKGVGGHPSDPEALQAQKHAFIYIQENNRADVRGLSIINHQRHMPPLDRDNAMPFRKEILDNSVQLKLGLMTTWDLFRLVRGALRNAWPASSVMPLFYGINRILPIPRHYKKIGTVNQVWKNAFSVSISIDGIDAGQRIAIELPVDFEEFQISSLRVNDKDVKSAQVGQEVGIAISAALPKLKAGFPVYRVDAV